MKFRQITIGLCVAAAAVAAAPAYAQAPAAARKVIPHPQASCIADIKRERADYQRNLEAGIKYGRFDAVEQAMLNKTHADLMKMEKKAEADHKISPAECRAIHAKIKEENKKQQMAIATLAKGSRPQAPCMAEIQRERATYQINLEAGIKSGKIDAKEHAMLNKTHADLMAAVAKANADGRISSAECRDFHARIMDENKKLQMAMPSPAKGPPKPWGR
jgi:hypothetical protein